MFIRFYLILIVFLFVYLGYHVMVKKEITIMPNVNMCEACCFVYVETLCYFLQANDRTSATSVEIASARKETSKFTFSATTRSILTSEWTSSSSHDRQASLCRHSLLRCLYSRMLQGQCRKARLSPAETVSCSHDPHSWFPLRAVFAPALAAAAAVESIF